MSEENTATNTSLTALLAKAKAKRVSDCCKHPPNYIPYTHTFYTTDWAVVSSCFSSSFDRCCYCCANALLGLTPDPYQHNQCIRGREGSVYSAGSTYNAHRLNSSSLCGMSQKETLHYIFASCTIKKRARFFRVSTLCPQPEVKAAVPIHRRAQLATMPAALQYNALKVSPLSQKKTHVACGTFY